MQMSLSRYSISSVSSCNNTVTENEAIRSKLLGLQAVAVIMWCYGTIGHDSPYVFEVLAGRARELLKSRSDSLTAEVLFPLLSSLSIMPFLSCRPVFLRHLEFLINHAEKLRFTDSC